jgi:hypothetical protein
MTGATDSAVILVSYGIQFELDPDIDDDDDDADV